MSTKLWACLDDDEFHTGIMCYCETEVDAIAICDAFGWTPEEVKPRSRDELAYYWVISRNAVDDQLPEGDGPLRVNKYADWVELLDLPECRWEWRCMIQPPRLEKFPEGWKAANELLNGILVVQGTNKQLVEDTYNAIWAHIKAKPGDYINTNIGWTNV